MYVTSVPNRTSPPAILIRESYREGDKVKVRTIANITKWPEQRIELLKKLLKGDLDEIVLEDEASRQGKAFGALFVLREMAKRIGLDALLGGTDKGRLALLLIFARLMIQGSRLKAARWAEEEAVEEVLGIDRVGEDDLYEVLDWLSDNQEKMEKKLFTARHAAPTLFLYDVTSSYLEGVENELADYGYNRDRKTGKKQIVIGLLADPCGDPVAVSVFEGNTIDPKTVEEQIKTLTRSFGVTEVILVGDRGMLKGPQIESLPEGFRYITAITKPQIRTLLEKGILQMELFEDSLAEVVHENVRYIIRRNPVRQGEIEQTRKSKLSRVAAFVAEKNAYLADHPKADPETAGRDITKKIAHFKMDAWVKAVREERIFRLAFDEEARSDAAALDGCYVIKSDVPEDKADKETLHARYKDLAFVEQDFRNMKTACLEVRPIYVRKKGRTKGHVFVVMLALLLKRHMEKLLTASYGEGRPAVSEVLASLDRLCCQERDIEGIPLRYIPIPDERQSGYLAALGVTLPKKLVSKNVRM
jgi:Transposase DDE domain